MEYEDLLAEVEFLNHRNIAFIESENLISGSLLQILKKDERFHVGRKNDRQYVFIKKIILCNWLLRIVLRLSQIQVFSISLNQFYSLFLNTFPKIAPYLNNHEWVEYFEKKKLISYSPQHETIKFPLSFFLSQLDSSIKKKVFKSIIELPFKQQSFSLEKDVLGIIAQTLNRISKNHQRKVVERVFLARKGIGESSKTLQKIASERNCTRERVRQIEKIFWKSANNREIKTNASIVILRFLISRNCSFLLHSNDPDIHYLKLLCKITGIQINDQKKLQATIIGFEESVLSNLTKSSNNHRIEPKEIENDLSELIKMGISEQDREELHKRTHQYRLKRISATNRLYLTLKHINRPAHYSEICEIHNLLFPCHSSNEHSIHSYLHNIQGKRGIVWIGIKGTFALTEWGYKKPEKSMYDLVADIVCQKYEETKKPVPLAFIHTEVSKVRKLVNPKSITMAATLNPKLECVFKDRFKPVDKNQQQKTERFDKETFADFVENNDEKGLETLGD